MTEQTITPELIENVINEMVARGGLVQNGDKVQLTDRGKEYIGTLNQTNSASNEERRDLRFKDRNFSIYLTEPSDRIFKVNEKKATQLLEGMKSKFFGVPKDNLWSYFPEDFREFRKNYQVCPDHFDDILNNTSVLCGVVFLDVEEVNMFAYLAILDCLTKAGVPNMTFGVETNQGTIQFYVDGKI